MPSLSLTGIAVVLAFGAPQLDNAGNCITIAQHHTMQNRTLKTLIISTTLTPSLIVALGLGMYLGHSRLQDLDRLLHDRGNASVVQVANAARQGILSGDARTLQNVVALALEEPGVSSVSIYDRDQRLLKRVGPQLYDVDTKSLNTRALTVSFEQSLRFVAPINSLSAFTATLSDIDADDPAPLGWVVIDYSREPNLVETYRSLFITGLIVALAFFGAAAIAVLSSRRLDRAVATLQNGVRRIEHGDFNTPIQIRNNGMLQSLAVDINRMAAAVQNAAIELQRNLEQTNRDLRESLETVEIQNIELDLARREAIAASRMKSEFLANTSHELRTPLNGIIGFTKLLLKTVLDARQRDYLETIRYSAENLLSIINDILDFSKIEAGKFTLDLAPFDLRELIEDTLAILAPSATEKKLELILLYDNAVPHALVGDPLRLRQVLTNLISNAIKFTLHGHVVVKVDLSDSLDTATSIKFSVVDTGIGIEASQQSQLFHAFTQVDASAAREFGGTGLGLAISKRLIEQMGGEIGVESQLNTGSTFWFSLRLQVQKNPLQIRRFDQLSGIKLSLYDPNPLSQLALRQLFESWQIVLTVFDKWPAEAAQVRCDGWLLNPAFGEPVPEFTSDIPVPRWLLQPRGAPLSIKGIDAAHVLPKPIHHVHLYDTLCSAFVQPTAPPLLPAPESKHAIRVLAVDDNTTNLKLIALLLEELNASNIFTTTTLATTGYQALELCAQQRFDLILLDIQMPELNGSQVAQLIRNGDNLNRHTRIAALTAHLLREEQSQLLANGFDDCLLKPVTEEQLKQLLKSCAQKSESDIVKPVRIDLCLSRARNKADLAKEFLQDLLRDLVSTREAIEKSAQIGNFSALLHEVHRLHGACCYTGVPRLQQCSYHLEDLLKRAANAGDIQAAASSLLDAIQELLEWNDSHDLDILFEDTVY
ncbi:MAG: ATP-binding protein [Spongiibacteraceae bacterium]